MTLGNHTYSHRNFNDLTIDEFQDQIIKGEVITRRLMEPHKPYQLYFRHPMTHTGDTREKKEAIEEFVAARGYPITPHTIENSDFIFNVPYAQAVRNGDAALAERMREAYLEYNLAVTKIRRAHFKRDFREGSCTDPGYSCKRHQRRLFRHHVDRLGRARLSLHYAR